MVDIQLRYLGRGIFLAMKQLIAPKVIKHLRQPTPTSCVPTSLAMVTGYSVKKVMEDYEEAFGDLGCGVSSREELYLLNMYGVVYDHVVITELRFGNLYLATVPSLNKVATNHSVVIDLRYDELEEEYRQILYDPNKGTGRKYYEYFAKKGRKGVALRGYSDLLIIH